MVKSKDIVPKSGKTVDQLDAMRVFVAVVDARGFSAASRKILMPIATISRKINQLEDHIGARLLIRNTRSIVPTDVGFRYYGEAQRILEDVKNAERQASGEFKRIAGLLTITAPSLFGRRFVLPIVTEFMKQHPEIQARMIFSNHPLQLADESIDLAVRIGPSAQAGMSSLPLGTMRQVVCASPILLADIDVPVDPSDLDGAPCITFSRKGAAVSWAFRTLSGEHNEIQIQPKLIVDSANSAIDAACDGVGITQSYAYQAAPEVAQGKLNVLLVDYEIEPVPVSLVYPRGPRVPLKLQSFTDFAEPLLQECLSDTRDVIGR